MINDNSTQNHLIYLTPRSILILLIPRHNTEKQLKTRLGNQYTLFHLIAPYNPLFLLFVHFQVNLNLFKVKT